MKKGGLKILPKLQEKLEIHIYVHIWHPVIMQTLIKCIVAKSLAKTNYGRLTERNSDYYELLLKRTLTHSPYNFLCKGSWLYYESYIVYVWKREIVASINLHRWGDQSQQLYDHYIDYGIYTCRKPSDHWRLYNQWCVVVLHNIFRIDWCFSKSIYEDKFLTKVVDTCIAFVSFQMLITLVCGKDLRLENKLWMRLKCKRTFINNKL